jgi:hypothetical protein
MELLDKLAITVKYKIHDFFYEKLFFTYFYPIYFAWFK